MSIFTFNRFVARSNIDTEHSNIISVDSLTEEEHKYILEAFEKGRPIFLYEGECHFFCGNSKEYNYNLLRVKDIGKVDNKITCFLLVNDYMSLQKDSSVHIFIRETK